MNGFCDIIHKGHRNAEKSLKLKKVPSFGLECFLFSKLSWLPGEFRGRRAEAGVCKLGVKHF